MDPPGPFFFFVCCLPRQEFSCVCLCVCVCLVLHSFLCVRVCVCVEDRCASNASVCAGNHAQNLLQDCIFFSSFATSILHIHQQQRVSMLLLLLLRKDCSSCWW